MRVRGRRVVLERLVVRDVVVLVAVLAGAAERHAYGRDVVADALVRGVWRQHLAGETAGELIRDELRRLLVSVTGVARRIRKTHARREAALEPAPRQSGVVQQIADVLPAHRDRVPRGAVVPVRLRIAGEREAA